MNKTSAAATAALAATREFFTAHGATSVRDASTSRRVIVEIRIPAETLIDLIPALRTASFRFVVTHSDIDAGIFRAEIA